MQKITSQVEIKLCAWNTASPRCHQTCRLPQDSVTSAGRINQVAARNDLNSRADGPAMVNYCPLTSKGNAFSKQVLTCNSHGRQKKNGDLWSYKHFEGEKKITANYLGALLCAGNFLKKNKVNKKKMKFPCRPRLRWVSGKSSGKVILTILLLLHCKRQLVYKNVVANTVSWTNTSAI